MTDSIQHPSLGRVLFFMGDVCYDYLVKLLLERYNAQHR